MYRIKVYSVGKTKEDWLQKAIEEYAERLRSSLHFEWILAKNDAQLHQFLEKESHFICLDLQAKQLTSEEFSRQLIQWLQDCGSRLCFVIGGAEGISAMIKTKARGMISLSKMTFTHQIARLILVEQIYRALEIEKGTAYHK